MSICHMSFTLPPYLNLKNVIIFFLKASLMVVHVQFYRIIAYSFSSFSSFSLSTFKLSSETFTTSTWKRNSFDNFASISSKLWNTFIKKTLFPFFLHTFLQYLMRLASLCLMLGWALAWLVSWASWGLEVNGLVHSPLCHAVNWRASCGACQVNTCAE